MRDLDAYILGVTRGDNILDEYEKLDKLDRASEYVMLGMRRQKGISGDEYRRVYRSDFTPIEKLLHEYEKSGWATQSEGRWAFTPTGFLLSNILIGALLEAQAAYRLSANPYRLSANPWMDGAGEGVAAFELPKDGTIH